MNKFQMTFGDYYNDGHGQYITVHLRSELTYSDIQHILDGIFRDYPLLMREGMAREYDEPRISPELWEVVKCFDYPMERLWHYLDDVSYVGATNELIQCYIDSGEITFNVETIADIWIWMLNIRGAKLEYDDAPETLFHFSDGYGCFLC